MLPTTLYTLLLLLHTTTTTIAAAALLLLLPRSGVRHSAYCGDCFGGASLLSPHQRVRLATEAPGARAAGREAEAGPPIQNHHVLPESLFRNTIPKYRLEALFRNICMWRRLGASSYRVDWLTMHVLHFKKYTVVKMTLYGREDYR